MSYRRVPYTKIFLTLNRMYLWCSSSFIDNNKMFEVKLISAEHCKCNWPFNWNVLFFAQIELLCVFLIESFHVHGIFVIEKRSLENWFWKRNIRESLWFQVHVLKCHCYSTYRTNGRNSKPKIPVWITSLLFASIKLLT